MEEREALERDLLAVTSEPPPRMLKLPKLLPILLPPPLLKLALLEGLDGLLLAAATARGRLGLLLALAPPPLLARVDPPPLPLALAAAGAGTVVVLT